MRFLTTVLALTALAAATTAAADVPSPPNFTVPYGVQIVAENGGGQPDPEGAFQVTIRDLANNPIQNSLVVLDFRACPDLALCANPLDPAAIVHCPTKTVRKFTDANGQVTFHVVGFSSATPGSPGPTQPAAKVYADGVLAANVLVVMYDLNGGGLGASDLSAWLDDFFSGNGVARADYDASGVLGASDLSRWLTVFFASGSVVNCTPSGDCP